MIKKHILFIVENNSIYNDARIFSEAVAAKEFGYDVSVICPISIKRKYEVEDLDGIKVYEHPRPPDGSGKLSLFLEYVIALFWEIILSIRVFVRHRFHVIHAANPPDHLFLVAALFKILGVKFIFDHHDLTPETYVAKFGRKGLLYAVLLIMERVTISTADLIISTNESYKQVAIERGGKDTCHVIVVRNGPDLSRIKQVTEDKLLRSGFDYLVGYVGIISQQEGIDNLLRAASYMVSVLHRTNVKFIIVGTGPFLSEMKKLSHDLALDHYVCFTGFVSDEQLTRILSSVDVCVNPEFRNEFTDKSTMIKIMEYMAFGRPVIQFYTKEGEVTAGESAFYVKENSVEEFAHAIIDVLEDRATREIMGSNGQKRIKEYLCWEKQKTKLKEAYELVFRS